MHRRFRRLPTFRSAFVLLILCGAAIAVLFPDCAFIGFMLGGVGILGALTGVPYRPLNMWMLGTTCVAALCSLGVTSVVYQAFITYTMPDADLEFHALIAAAAGVVAAMLALPGGWWWASKRATAYTESRR